MKQSLNRAIKLMGSITIIPLFFFLTSAHAAVPNSNLTPNSQKSISPNISTNKPKRVKCHRHRKYCRDLFKYSCYGDAYPGSCFPLHLGHPDDFKQDPKL